MLMMYFYQKTIAELKEKIKLMHTQLNSLVRILKEMTPDQSNQEHWSSKGLETVTTAMERTKWTKEYTWPKQTVNPTAEKKMKLNAILWKLIPGGIKMYMSNVKIESF